MPLRHSAEANAGEDSCTKQAQPLRPSFPHLMDSQRWDTACLNRRESPFFDNPIKLDHTEPNLRKILNRWHSVPQRSGVDSLWLHDA